MSDLTRQELVARVIELRKCQWSEDELEGLLALIENSVPCPFDQVQHLIFNTDLPAEEVVDKMLAYRPIQL